MNNRLINTKVAGGGGCTDIVDNYDPFGGSGVALYQLNGDATDVSGNYDGTASNVTYGTGIFGQAGVFNGSSSYISTGINYTALSEVTYSAWVLINNAVSNDAILGGVNGSYGNTGYLSINPTISRFDYISSDNNYRRHALSVSNGWHNFVVTDDKLGNVNMYVDGVEVSYTITTTQSYTANTNIQIGRAMRNTGAIGNYNNGSIDQVRIFNEALTPLEVEALYTEELCICGGTVDTLDILGDASCIATYQLDGNANDLSGNYSGTPTNVNYNYGEFDVAGVFNGSTSYITLPITQSNDISISAWVKIEDLTRQHQIISYDLGGVSTNRCLQFRVEFDQTVSAYWFSGTKAVSTSSLSQGVWAHVVATWEDNGTQKIYFNGQQEDSNAATTRPNFPNLFIGKRNIGGSTVDDFLGSIDQVRIFNKALSSSEVTTLYNETACVTPDPEPILAPDPNVMSVESQITNLPGGTYTPTGIHIDKLKGEYFYYSNSNGASNNTGFSLAKLATPYDASTAYSLGQSANTASNSYHYCLGGDKLGYNIVGTGRSNSGVPTGKRVVRFEIQPSWTVPQTPIYNTRFSNYNTFTGITFNDDGTKMLATNTDGQFIQSILSNPYNIDSATSSAVYNINNYSTQEFSAALRYIPFGIDWSGDGTSLYMGMSLYNANAGTYGTFYGTTLKCFNASTPYDVTTLSERPLSTSKTLDTWFYGNYDYDISVTDNGKVAIIKQQSVNGAKSVYIFA